MKLHADTDFAAFIGLDWADAKHDLCMQITHSEEREFSVLPHRADAIEAWARSLRQRFAGQPVAASVRTGQQARPHLLPDAAR